MILWVAVGACAQAVVVLHPLNLRHILIDIIPIRTHFLWVAVLLLIYLVSHLVSHFRATRQSPRHPFAPICPYCPVSHIRREPEAETEDSAEASEAAAAE